MEWDEVRYFLAVSRSGGASEPMGVESISNHHKVAGIRTPF
jgi:hypothetical protein